MHTRRNSGISELFLVYFVYLIRLIICVHIMLYLVYSVVVINFEMIDIILGKDNIFN